MNKFNKICDKLATWLLWIIAIIILYLITYKQIEGRYMMNEDYYNAKTK